MQAFFIVIPIDHNGHISPWHHPIPIPVYVSQAQAFAFQRILHMVYCGLNGRHFPFCRLDLRRNSLFVLHASENGPFHSIPISSGRFCTGGFPHRRKLLLVAQSGQPVQLIVHLEAEGPVGRQALFGSLVQCHPPVLGLGEGLLLQPQGYF